jgi:galactose mutarotase-like enzyme
VITLRAGALTARIARRGAELQSLRRGDDEFLWQPQPGIWHQTAPWLFPMVGRLRGGGFTHAGRRHELPIHGFAAQLDFEPLAQSDAAVTLRLRSNAHTRACYPFDFRLDIDYRLDARGLHIGLAVEAGSELAFGLGGHPGFALAGSLRDWQLRFEQPEADTVWRLQPDPPPLGLRAATPEPWPRADARLLPLHAGLFTRDALILDPVRSAWVALEHKTQGERLRLHLGGAPQLGLWARPGAPYVCIEPWWGRDDATDAPEAWFDKPQLLRLKASERFERRLHISLS